MDFVGGPKRTKIYATHSSSHLGSDSIDALRNAAQQADRRSGGAAGDRSHEALDAWEDMLDGSLSMVDWFDTRTRRFIVLRPNPPGFHDPRGLTSGEREVAYCVARGDTNKAIGSQVGLSRTRVSELVLSVLDKLGLRTKSQLVYFVQGLGLPIAPRGSAKHRES